MADIGAREFWILSDISEVSFCGPCYEINWFFVILWNYVKLLLHMLIIFKSIWFWTFCIKVIREILFRFCLSDRRTYWSLLFFMIIFFILLRISNVPTINKCLITSLKEQIKIIFINRIFKPNLFIQLTFYLLYWCLFRTCILKVWLG